MRLLVDSHAMLWFVQANANLSAAASAALADPSNELLFSAGSIWEIAIKVGLGKLTLAKPFPVFMCHAISSNNLVVLPIELAHMTALIGLPLHHRDPFDRLLVAQAIVEQTSIVSVDSAFDAYPVTRLW
jgi:PIN domain nuclease of toxin-antitoxin system